MNKQSEMLEQSKAILARHGFAPIRILGKGKDAIAFKAAKNDKRYVAKVLSGYAKAFLPVTKDVLAKVQSSHFMKVTFSDNDVLYYDHLKLESPNASPEILLKALLQVCDLQQELIAKGLVVWDFGVTGTNYMLLGDDVKWVDYGGNGFAYLDPSQAPIKPPRKNLVYANNLLVKSSLLLHLLVIGYGQTMLAKHASWMQDNDGLEGLNRRLLTFFNGSGYEPVAKQILASNLLTTQGWSELKAVMESVVNSASASVQERADITSVEEVDGRIEVRGYQNYIINKTELTPLQQGHHWANTNTKWQIVAGIMQRLEFNSYLDVGCNLGLYVFTAKVLCGSDVAVGADYNQDYLDVCAGISDRFDLGCEFQTKPFGDISETYDCVSMLGLIHHIYCRTESFSNFDAILGHLANITRKSAIIEFPTENDLKAMKWVNIPSRGVKEKYNLANFLKSSRKHFSNIEKVDDTTPDRPVYLLTK